MKKFQQMAFDLARKNGLNLLDQPRSIEAYENASYSFKPNLQLPDFIHQHLSGDQTEVNQPFTSDLVSGKNTYAYDAHTYHTKVPPEAIEKLLAYYTSPGELVLDPFCGSGMTGLASVRQDRKPILIDLSPAATFITSNFISTVESVKYFDAIKDILDYVGNKELELYGTHCRTCGKLVPLEYMVWSYGLLCNDCQNEFLLWDVARDERSNVKESKIKTEFDCPHCGKHLLKRSLRRTKLYPVQVGYRCCSSKNNRETTDIPDEYDLEVIRVSDQTRISNLWYPDTSLPLGINTRQAIAHGMDSVDKFYTTRNLYAVALLWDVARRWPNIEISKKLLFTVTSLYQRVTKLSEFRFWGGSGNIANYNVPMIFNEQNVFKVFYRKAKTIQFYLETRPATTNLNYCISTQSATDLSNIPDNSIDYIFTDPPFGGNINYSEMNFLWESWLNVFTNTKDEAIVNQFQGKSIVEYQALIVQALQEMYRVLKPTKWMSLVFHNSSAKVWTAIQQAINASGFILVNIQTLDKQHGTFKQFVSDNSVGYDLIIHCRKAPNGKPESWAIRPSKVIVEVGDLQNFIFRKLANGQDDYVVHYLHVNRRNELDLRKLYSLWLKEVMEGGKLVTLSYSEFRQQVLPIIQTHFPSLNFGEE